MIDRTETRTASDGGETAAEAGLSARVRVLRAGLTLEVDCEVRPGEVVAVLGPNGAGKSTLLGALSGTVAADSGLVRLNGRTWLDTAHRLDMPTHRRRCGVLEQRARLFPNLSVLDNVAFGPRAAGYRKAGAREIARGWLAETEAVELADRKPAKLSGGQAQRVALARALAAEPELLMLDEPLSALDVEAAPVMRGLLHRVLGARDRPSLLVTHDVLDALVLADRVLVLNEGRVVESGRTDRVLSRPKAAFTAQLAGLNLVTGTARDGGVELGGSTVRGRVVEELEPGLPAAAVFAPSAVAVHREEPSGSPRNTLAVRLVAIQPRGDVVRLRGEPLASQPGADSPVAADVTPAAVAELGLRLADQVYFAVKATEVAIHPVSGGSSGRD